MDYTMSRGLRFKRSCLTAVFQAMLNALGSPSTVQRFYLEVIKMVGKVGLCCFIGTWIASWILIAYDPFYNVIINAPDSEWITEASKRFVDEIRYAATVYLALIPVILILNQMEGRSVRELIKPIR